VQDSRLDTSPARKVTKRDDAVEGTSEEKAGDGRMTFYEEWENTDQNEYADDQSPGQLCRRSVYHVE
jgi:hypothetical protein